MEWTIWAGFAAGLLISTVTAPVGVSGAVFLLPVQLSVLGVPSPAVTPTNLLFEKSLCFIEERLAARRCDDGACAVVEDLESGGCLQHLQPAVE